jgi:hypothetical protein
VKKDKLMRIIAVVCDAQCVAPFVSSLNPGQALRYLDSVQSEIADVVQPSLASLSGDFSTLIVKPPARLPLPTHITIHRYCTALHVTSLAEQLLQRRAVYSQVLYSNCVDWRCAWWSRTSSDAPSSA